MTDDVVAAGGHVVGEKAGAKDEKDAFATLEFCVMKKASHDMTHRRPMATAQHIADFLLSRA